MVIYNKPQDKQFLRRDQRRPSGLPRVGVDSYPCEEHKVAFLISYNEILPKKMVVSFEKLGQIFVVEDKKRWFLQQASRQAIPSVEINVVFRCASCWDRFA